jgi:O-antigen ligase
MPDPSVERAEESAPLIWRSLPLRLTIGVIPFLLIVSALVSRVDWPLKLLIAATFACSLAAPAGGLLLVAALAPLSNVFAPAIGAVGFRVDEALVLAFLLGWLLQDFPARRGPRVAAPAAGWLFAAVIVASVAGLALQLGRFPDQLPYVIGQIGHSYFMIQDAIGVVEGARLLEGVALVAATVMIFRRQPALATTLPLALGGSATAAALSSVMLSRGIGTAVALAQQRLIGGRFGGLVGDVNAAGSYFAMMLCLALGMAVRERDRIRALWCGLAAATGAGLWLSGSRSALGAAGAVIVVAVIWAATTRVNLRARALMLIVVVVALAGAAAMRARVLERDPDYKGFGFRQQFVQTSLRMIESRPLFGVGVGQYYRTSPLFLSPQLAWTYGAENGHNYFLQIGGELGLVGLGLFAAWLGATMARTLRALAREPADARLLGAAAGVVVFLITCLTGHPFLVGAVAYPFWLQVGLMTALAGSTLMNQTSAAERPAVPSGRAWAHGALAAAIVILVWSPIATAKIADRAPDSPAVDGFYRWETLEDGMRFRWSARYASLFVPAEVTRVEIPVRLPVDNRSISPMGLEIRTAGADRGRTMVDGTWAIISVKLPGILPPTRFQRVDLRIDRAWQPAFYIAGNGDLRAVGVQVGEVRLFRD